MLKIYNTRTKKIEEFVPQDSGGVKMYCCGPTVYDYTHLGHVRKYYFDFVLKQALSLSGLNVNHVLNVTDVGHLSDDGDNGEDKMEKGAIKSGKSVWEVAKYFEDYYIATMDRLGISRPSTLCRATDHIDSMIIMNKSLEDRGFAYETDEALYYDTSKFEHYGRLSGQNQNDKVIGSREEVVTDSHKKNPADFALWFKCVGKFAHHTMRWESPWGVGFPGWHIECSAMARKYLGDRLDIHTGGIDHIPVHHENEIAQSEAATGASPFVSYWVHHNHLFIEGQKMSKSLGNFLRLEDVEARDINPDALKLLFLQTSYRAEQNFTWEALEAAANALSSARRKLNHKKVTPVLEVDTDLEIVKSFKNYLFDDLGTAQAVALLFKSIDTASDTELANLATLFKTTFAINLVSIASDSQIPEQIHELAHKRAMAKKAKDFARADELRQKITNLGYRVHDVADGGYDVSKS